MLQMPPMAQAISINVTNFRGVICTTCLCSDRVLYPLQKSPQLLNICNGFTLNLQDKICWECKAQLTKMFKFRHKALQSRSVLACLLQLNQASITGQQNILIQSLTTLSKTQKFYYEVGINPLQQEIKTEAEQECIDVIPKLEPETSLQIEVPPISPAKSEPGRASSPDSDNVCDVTEAPDRDQIEGITLKTMSEEEMLQFREKERQVKRYQNCKSRCETCIQCFNSNDLLIKHNDLVHSQLNGPFICRVCEQRFVYDSALHKHLKVHYKYYECKECSFSHQLLNGMLIHRRVKHNPTPRSCGHCGKLFNSWHSLRAHLGTTHESTRVKPRCEVCGKQYSQRSQLNKHMLVHTTGVPMVQCAVCHKQYRGEWGLKAHMRTHTDTVDEDAYCAECDTQFKNIYLYRVHLKQSRKHADPNMYKFQCADCDKKFFVKAKLRAHIENVHLQLKNNSCDVCDAKFYLRTALNRHKRNKHSEGVKSRRHVCHICGKAFLSKQSLDQHTNSHLGVRPYKCNICGDTFSYSGALYTHKKLVHLKRQRPKRTR